ncbi:MAG: TlpA disulfide reductase family protein [Paludibacteraceae bacterium]
MLKKTLYFLIFTITFVACNHSTKFTVVGTIANADEQILYFVHSGLLKDSLIDSVRLDKNGDFKFKALRPKYPDLYKLELGNQKLILGVDSTEEIRVTANAKQLIDAKISNSDVSADIQRLRKSIVNLQNRATTIGQEKDPEKQKLMIRSFETEIATHKKDVMDLVLKNPRSIAAYFALYQQVNGLYVVSPYDKADRVYFSAVATAFDTYMTDYERSKSLHNLVVTALQQDRIQKQQLAMEMLQNKAGVDFPEIELKDNNGYVKKLSDLRGKTIVLDFSAAEMEHNVEYTFELRDIFNKYSAQGLMIYQVSLDQNKMLWERSVSNLPWICVRDENGAESKYVSLYNVSAVPTLFLIDKKGAIIGRYTNFESLQKDIKRVI